MRIRYLYFFLVFSTFLFSYDYLQKDQYITTLKPYNSTIEKFDNTHVIQGIASYGNKWIVSQAIKNRYLLINVLDSNGTSIADELFDIHSHGVDLSICTSNDKKVLYIYTQGKHRKGIVKLSTSINDFDLKIDKNISLDIFGTIPTISENKAYFTVKSKDSIYIYRYIDIEKNIKPREIFSFLLSPVQRKKDQWFQGIAMKDGKIYCLTGDNTLKGKKYLYIYDSYGRVVNKYELHTGRDFSKSLGDKWELEGLAFKGKELYTIVISKDKYRHYMKLYKILKLIEISNKR